MRHSADRIRIDAAIRNQLLGDRITQCDNQIGMIEIATQPSMYQSGSVARMADSVMRHDDVAN